MKNLMKNTKLVSIAAFLVLAAGLAGCPVRGTSEPFHVLGDIKNMNFEILKAKLLIPFDCIHCHAGGSQPLDTEADVLKFVIPGQSRSSRLWEVIERGEMPKGGSKLSDAYCDMVAMYIDGLAPGGPTPTPTPAPLPLEPTFTSLQSNLFAVSCRGCHGGGPTPPTKRADLTKYDIVKENADEIVERLTGDPNVDPMPPPKSGRPVPKPEVVETLKEWIKRGFPPN